MIQNQCHNGEPIFMLQCHDIDDAYVGHSGQMRLFDPAPRDVCRMMGLNWLAALHLRDKKRLSFDPESKQFLNLAEESELLFVGSLAACDLDENQIRRFLSGLRKPYQYLPEKVYFDWIHKQWKMLPRTNDSDSVDVEKLIEDLKEDGDIDHLQELAKLIEMAIQELEEDTDCCYEDS